MALFGQTVCPMLPLLFGSRTHLRQISAIHPDNEIVTVTTFSTGWWWGTGSASRRINNRQKQNGTRTPCGTSASFSSCLPGDGRPEVLDPDSGSPFRAAESAKHSAWAGLRTCHSDVDEL